MRESTDVTDSMGVRADRQHLNKREFPVGTEMISKLCSFKDKKQHLDQFELELPPAVFVRFEQLGRDKWGWTTAVANAKWQDALADPTVPKGTDGEGALLDQCQTCKPAR